LFINKVKRFFLQSEAAQKENAINCIVTHSILIKVDTKYEGLLESKIR